MTLAVTKAMQVSATYNLANPASKFLELPLLRQFTRYHLNRNRVEIRHPSHMFPVKFIAVGARAHQVRRTQSDPLRGRAGRTLSALPPRPLRRRYRWSHRPSGYNGMPYEAADPQVSNGNRVHLCCYEHAVGWSDIELPKHLASLHLYSSVLRDFSPHSL